MNPSQGRKKCHQDLKYSHLKRKYFTLRKPQATIEEQERSGCSCSGRDARPIKESWSLVTR
jgi:hypothetical protein